MEPRIVYTDLANYFIALSNETGSLITNLKLQKLMYYAQAWNLGVHNNRLFDGEFEAWVHGPVLTSLYHNYKEFGWEPIINKDLNEDQVSEFLGSIHIDDRNMVNDVTNEYFGLPAYELERLTHEEKPWQLARGKLAIDEPSSEIIKDEWMIEYYSQFVK